MNNTLLLSLATSVIPLLAICFVCALLAFKVYVKVRSRYNATVNCWFCNENHKVPYLEANSWTCPACEQYNGFTKDGDYNRQIYQQLDCSAASSERLPAPPTPQNGFCSACNEAQRLKVEKLSQFEPKKESRFEQELQVYKARLEEEHRLCTTCDRHLHRVLRDKKRMVLGSKFLDFIIKGAESLKRPHFQQLHEEKQQRRKRRYAHLVTTLAVLNLWCLLSVIPTLERASFTRILGETVGTHFFLLLSHPVALWRVCASYVGRLGQTEILAKMSLFCRTVFLMALYSLGLNGPAGERHTFAVVYMRACPFLVLGLTFAHNLVDGFRVTRFTFLLALWSALAGGLADYQALISPNLLVWFGTLLTLCLSSTARSNASAKLLDNDGAATFHKMYTEDYFSDEDTMSLLSQQLNSSAASMRSNASSYRTTTNTATTAATRPLRSPLIASPSCLSQSRREPFSPNESFQTFSFCDASQSNRARSQFAPSVCNFEAARSPSMFGSSQELNYRNRRTLFGGNLASPSLNSSFCAPQHPLMQNNGRSFGGGASTPLPQASPFATDRTSNLLMPSRFGGHPQPTAGSNGGPSLWQSNGGGYNYLRSSASQPTQQCNFFQEQRFPNSLGLMTNGCEEKMSRSSSQSSGFESHNDRLNRSRESSHGPELRDEPPKDRTPPKDNLNYPSNVFEHIEARMHRGSLSVASGFAAQPPPLNRVDVWSPAPSQIRRNGDTDFFNLRKITEELPTLKRGDLLKRWKEGQMMS